ncbi:DUF1963 domain-containing protein [Streptomyces sp. MB09-01]|uniref:DUF1963 domain-containing protein n=1 Tax=Streptomyces sp. MB09-01 TaxID=3028666 RepID=UPI0029B77D68|nr:DUF1963 domain-containing protein [Streptomyces sp. MB09-01]MDX3534561.1 DUF1963 domain-containing protein [Streptomyces sp. MB09-01]
MPLTAQAGLTVPASDAPGMRAVFGEAVHPREWRRHPVNARPFCDALTALDPEPSRSGHGLGGRAVPVQGAVEWEVAHAVLGPGASWQDPRVNEEAAKWVLLAQIDTDCAADMTWGDVGTLYWLIRPADLAAGRFEEALFTWQGC